MVLLEELKNKIKNKNKIKRLTDGYRSQTSCTLGKHLHHLATVDTSPLLKRYMYKTFKICDIFFKLVHI